MALEKLFDEVESPRTAATVNVASGKRSFFKNITSLPVAWKLRQACVKPDAAALVVSRVMSLAERSVDERYENPHDTSLCIYLWALQTRRPDLARIAAGAIREARNCWWSSELASQVVGRNQGGNTPQERG